MSNKTDNEDVGRHKTNAGYSYPQPGSWGFCLSVVAPAMWSIYESDGCGSKQHIAEVFGQHVLASNHSAHIIAASPDLLAACEAAESLLKREGYFGGVSDQLNAAIAKARGQ